MSGFIKVYREQLQSDLFRNPAVLYVWIFLCEQARFKATVQDGIEIHPGQVLISASEIGRNCRLKEGRVRYILGNLEKNGLIRRQNIRNRYSLITVLDPSAQNDVQDTNDAAQTGVAPAANDHNDTRSDVTHTACDPHSDSVAGTTCAPQPTAVPYADRSAFFTCVPSTDSVPTDGMQTKTQLTPSAGSIPTAATENMQKQPEKGSKTAFGLFGNVLLSSEEKRILSERSACSDNYIDNLSAYKKRTKKEYEDDFTVLCEWISKDDISEKRAAARQAAQQLKNTKEKTAVDINAAPRCVQMLSDSSPASYDLERAERQARESVPKLRKRPKK